MHYLKDVTQSELYDFSTLERKPKPTNSNAPKPYLDKHWKEDLAWQLKDIEGVGDFSFSEGDDSSIWDYNISDIGYPPGYSL